MKTLTLGSLVSFKHKSARDSGKTHRRGDVQALIGKNALVNCSGDIIEVPISKLIVQSK